MLKLSNLEFKTLSVECARCDRSGRYRVSGLLEKHGDIALARLAEKLSSDCEHFNDPWASAKCSVYFPDLVQGR